MPASSQIPEPSGGYDGRDLGDEYIFYDREGDQIHILNATAREIYLLSDGSRSETEIAGVIAERYGIDEETARTDTRTTLATLVELGVLRTGA